MMQSRVAKGQLIFKCFFVFNFFQKTKTHRIVVKTNSFIHFLEEFTAWQFAFKIIWPLLAGFTGRQSVMPLGEIVTLSQPRKVSSKLLVTVVVSHTVKFKFSLKATQFVMISHLHLMFTWSNISGRFFSNFVAFSEYMNFSSLSSRGLSCVA